MGAGGPVALSVVETGQGPPVAILHGLFGSALNWASIARSLGARFRVLALDARNHGNSPWAWRCDYPVMTSDVIHALKQRGINQCAVIGHSMGGKTAMTLALTRPEMVDRLVIVDIAPVRYEPRVIGYVEAMLAVDLNAVGRRTDADAALAQSVPDAETRQFLLQNLSADATGRYRWKIHLEALRAGIAVLAAFPEMPNGVRYAGPTLFVAGERSDYIQPRHAAAIRAMFPAARTEVVARAGHWVHAQNPQGFLACIEPFLAARSPESSF
ncbi:MAG: alpha/beta fold hydrolase [Alphaproteobacteria bacterium]|nr:alpha/beta fold hydrolase [Alphaproteobacteria bacterium]